VKIGWRILPFLLALYVMSYLDRTNVAFARVPMSQDLGFSERVYGIGSGLFFIGYFLLGIPGALMVEKWGARLLVGWAAMAWGSVTLLFPFLRTAAGFYSLRCLLGLAAAPFFPGVVVYISRRFPLRERSRALAGFMIAAPISLTIGGPLSALLLHLEGFGFHGWQWVFIIEGLITVAMGALVFAILDDSPRASSTPTDAVNPVKWWTALAQRNVLLLCLAHACANMAGYGYVFWLPSAIQNAMGTATGGANEISAIPFGLSAAAMWLMARSSDRSGERKFHACLPMFAAAGFFLATLIPGQPPALTLVWICLTGACIFAWIPGFWAMPTAVATGTARASAIGLINSIGNLGGFLGPAIIGALLTETHSSRTLPLLVASSYCASAVFVTFVRLPRELQASS
jgi:ACS family tartrate transporter-like MFS transporter